VTNDGTPAPVRPRWRRWLAPTLVTAWTLVVAGLTIAAIDGARPTAPEQTPIAEVLPQADGVLADLIDALDPTRTVVALGDYRRIGGRCRITTARSGTRYSRVLTAYSTQGGESPLLVGLAGRLPDRYEPHLTSLRGTPVLTGMDRRYIGIRGVVEGHGVIRLTIDTGCRPGVPGASASLAGVTVEAAPAAATAAARAAMGGLGLTPQRWTATAAGCRAAGRLWTVEATASTPGVAAQPAPSTGASGVPSAVPSTAPSTGPSVGPSGPQAMEPVVVLDRPETVAYRSAAVGTVIRRGGDAVTVTVTAGCVA
jgi:hypothetical protein